MKQVLQACRDELARLWDASYQYALNKNTMDFSSQLNRFKNILEVISTGGTKCSFGSSLKLTTGYPTV